jgi:hypothetical protein
MNHTCPPWQNWTARVETPCGACAEQAALRRPLPDVTHPGRVRFIDAIAIEPYSEPQPNDFTHVAAYRWHAEDDGAHRFGAAGSFSFSYHGEHPVEWATMLLRDMINPTAEEDA